MPHSSGGGSHSGGSHSGSHHSSHSHGGSGRSSRHVRSTYFPDAEDMYIMIITDLSMSMQIMT